MAKGIGGGCRIDLAEMRQFVTFQPGIDVIVSWLTVALSVCLYTVGQ